VSTVTKTDERRGDHLLDVHRLLPAGRRVVRSKVITGTAAAALAVISFGVVLPRIAGTTWSGIAAAWHSVPWWQLALLCGLWFVGLVAHSFVLTAAMPGLTRRRALTLSLTGSAVANVLPMGGGAGIALNFVMAKRWGFTSGQFSLFTLVSNAANVLAKATLPLLALVALLATDAPVDHRFLVVALAGSALLIGVLMAAGYAVGSQRGGRLAAGLVVTTRRALRFPVEHGATEARLGSLRSSTGALVRSGWTRMTAGMTAYSALGALLLWSCLHVLGAGLGFAAVIALFAVERGMTALPFTPGGAGLAEVATTAFALHMLASTGSDPAAVAAGVLLYRGLAFGAEIPVGGAWLVGWLLLSRLRASHLRPQAAGAA
jgi:putative heme transporter